MKEAIQKDRKRLLLVDDDPNLIMLVQDYLQCQGYEVITAENGHEALDILGKDKIDMVICDVMMPGMDGYAMVRQVREDPAVAAIPILFLSAKGQSQDRVKGLNTGADVYMIKPFEPEELVAQVQSSLKRSQRQHPSWLGDNGSRLKVPAEIKLTPTEARVLNRVAQGMGNREIADEVGVSQRTIESHVSNMLGKTGLSNRTELARWAMENSIV